MDGLRSEVSRKIKDAIKAKLVELGITVDEELPDYVMVLVVNKKSREQMEQNLSLFLMEHTAAFVNWLQGVLGKLQALSMQARAPKPVKPVPPPADAAASAEPSGEASCTVGDQEPALPVRCQSPEPACSPPEEPAAAPEPVASAEKATPSPGTSRSPPPTGLEAGGTPPGRGDEPSACQEVSSPPAGEPAQPERNQEVVVQDQCRSPTKESGQLPQEGELENKQSGASSPSSVGKVQPSRGSQSPEASGSVESERKRSSPSPDRVVGTTAHSAPAEQPSDKPQQPCDRISDDETGRTASDSLVKPQANGRSSPLREERIPTGAGSVLEERSETKRKRSLSSDRASEKRDRKKAAADKRERSQSRKSSSKKRTRKRSPLLDDEREGKRGSKRRGSSHVDDSRRDPVSPSVRNKDSPEMLNRRAEDRLEGDATDSSPKEERLVLRRAITPENKPVLDGHSRSPEDLPKSKRVNHSPNERDEHREISHSGERRVVRRVSISPVASSDSGHLGRTPDKDPRPRSPSSSPASSQSSSSSSGSSDEDSSGSLHWCERTPPRSTALAPPRRFGSSRGDNQPPAGDAPSKTKRNTAGEATSKRTKTDLRESATVIESGAMGDGANSRRKDGKVRSASKDKGAEATRKAERMSESGKDLEKTKKDERTSRAKKETGANSDVSKASKTGRDSERITKTNNEGETGTDSASTGKKSSKTEVSKADRAGKADDTRRDERDSKKADVRGERTRRWEGDSARRAEEEAERAVRQAVMAAEETMRRHPRVSFPSNRSSSYRNGELEDRSSRPAVGGGRIINLREESSFPRRRRSSSRSVSPRRGRRSRSPWQRPQPRRRRSRSPDGYHSQRRSSSQPRVQGGPRRLRRSDSSGSSDGSDASGDARVPSAVRVTDRPRPPAHLLPKPALLVKAMRDASRSTTDPVRQSPEPEPQPAGERRRPQKKKKAALFTKDLRAGRSSPTQPAGAAAAAATSSIKSRLGLPARSRDSAPRRRRAQS